jgi:hypothetical protein
MSDQDEARTVQEEMEVGDVCEECLSEICEDCGECQEHCDCDGVWSESFEDWMSVRDNFAGIALEAILKIPHDNFKEDVIKSDCELAYKYAHKMMEAR